MATFEVRVGFLGAGDEARAPAELSVAGCETACVGLVSCLGFTFQASRARPADPVKCYFKSWIKLTAAQEHCVAPGGAGKPACSPLPGEMGLGGYYGHYQGHWLSAMAFLANATGNATVAEAAEQVVEVYASVMEAWRARYGDAEDGYLFPYDPLVWDQLLSGRGAAPYYSVPFYTLVNPNFLFTLTLTLTLTPTLSLTLIPTRCPFTRCTS